MRRATRACGRAVWILASLPGRPPWPALRSAPLRPWPAPGAAIGAVASVAGAWISQRILSRERSIEVERGTRQSLFAEFISEASITYDDALSHQKEDVTNLVNLYALVARIRLVATEPVVSCARETLAAIIDAYLSPNRTRQDLKTLAADGRMNFLLAFSNACREEINGIGSKRAWRR